MKKVFPLLVVFLLLPACSQFHVPPYSVNHKSVSELRKVRDTGSSVTVGNVSGMNQAATTMTCRAVGPIKPAGSGTFGQYVKDALIAEMSIAEVYLADSDVLVDLDFSKFDFGSASGEWVMAANVNVKGSTFPVTVTHTFSPSWYGETACDQTAQAMMPAVQEFVYQLVSNPRFHQIVAGSTATQSAR